MKDDEYRLFFDDGLLFLNEVTYFTPDLQRMVFKLSEKFEIEYDMAESFVNFPLIDKMMFSVGERFSEKFVQVASNRSIISNSRSTGRSSNWKTSSFLMSAKFFRSSTKKRVKLCSLKRFFTKRSSIKLWILF